MSAGAYLFPGNGVLRALRVVSKGFYNPPALAVGSLTDPVHSYLWELVVVFGYDPNSVGYKPTALTTVLHDHIAGLSRLSSTTTTDFKSPD